MCFFFDFYYIAYLNVLGRIGSDRIVANRTLLTLTTRWKYEKAPW